MNLWVFTEFLFLKPSCFRLLQNLSYDIVGSVILPAVSYYRIFLVMGYYIILPAVSVSRYRILLVMGYIFTAVGSSCSWSL